MSKTLLIIVGLACAVITACLPLGMAAGCTPIEQPSTPPENGVQADTKAAKSPQAPQTIRAADPTKQKEISDEIKRILRADTSCSGPTPTLQKVFGKKEFVPELMNILHNDTDISFPSAEILAYIHDREIMPEVIEMLKTDDIRKMSNACYLIREFHATEAIPALMNILENSDDVTRKNGVVSTLGHIGAKESIPDIMKLLDTKDMGLRQTVIRVLGELDAKKAIPKLLELLSKDPAAIHALARLKAKEAIPGIINSLKERGPNAICIDHIFALRDLEAKEAIPEMINLINAKDTSEYVRPYAALFIVELGGKDQLPLKNIKNIFYFFHITTKGGAKNTKLESRAETALKELGLAEEEIKLAKGPVGKYIEYKATKAWENFISILQTGDEEKVKSVSTEKGYSLLRPHKEGFIKVSETWRNYILTWVVLQENLAIGDIGPPLKSRTLSHSIHFVQIDDKWKFDYCSSFE